MIEHVLSNSTGKDSSALLALAVAQEIPRITCVFADTGNEHPLTYEHAHYLSDWLQRQGHAPLRWVTADLSSLVLRQRIYVAKHWPAKLEKAGYDWESIADILEAALSALHPTGNPYLDLCLSKGRFPSRMAQFCTQHLKRDPIINQVMLPLLDEGKTVWSWQGVRREESLARRFLPEFEEIGGGLFNYRPLVKWDLGGVFEAMAYMGMKPNPLYSQGMNRVGCMPCINASKDEIRAIAERFPEVIDRIRRWEQVVSRASKRGCATFFKIGTDPLASLFDELAPETHGIDSIVEWSKTTRGGRQFDIFNEPATACSSAYGLCE